MSMLTAQANHLRELSYTVERVKNDSVGKLSLSGSIALAMAAMDMRDAADTIDELRNTCQDLQRENAKLKELVRDMKHHICRMHADDPCDAVCDAYDSGLRTCSYELRMRELGVEVD